MAGEESRVPAVQVRSMLQCCGCGNTAKRFTFTQEPVRGKRVDSPPLLRLVAALARK